MKKILGLGADIPMGVQVTKLMREMEQEAIIANNNHEIKNTMREQYLLTNPDLGAISAQTMYFDKPKSKYHK